MTLPESADETTEAAPASADAAAAVDPHRRRVCLWTLAGVAVGAVLLDRLAKAWVATHDVGETFAEFFGGLVRFTYVQNSGAAFSIGAGYTWIFTIVAVAVAIVILRTSRRLGSIWWAVALGGLLGGLLGNLIDRLTRPPGFGVGHVVDFVQVSHFGGIFNVADAFITCSAVLMVILALRGIEITGGRS